MAKNFEHFQCRIEPGKVLTNDHRMFIIYSQYNLYGLSKYRELVDGMSTARQEHLSNDIEFFPIPSSKILLKFATELIVKIANAYMGSRYDTKTNEHNEGKNEKTTELEKGEILGPGRGDQ